MPGEQESADLAIFQVLANELPGDERKKTDARIKRKLQRAKVPYQQPHVDRVRALHAALRDEISKMQRSKYHRGAAGAFAAPEDFDTEGMVRHYRAKYPEISEEDLQRMVGFAVYLYYLR